MTKLDELKHFKSSIQQDMDVLHKRWTDLQAKSIFVEGRIAQQIEIDAENPTVEPSESEETNA